MPNAKSKIYLDKKNLEKHSIWLYNEDDDLHYPIQRSEDFPEELDIYNLSIRTTFTIPSGVKFSGFIIGEKNIFCIAIFWNGETLYLNKNIIENCIKNIAKINKTLDPKIPLGNFFPMHYETTINIEGFTNLEGEFDVFQKRTNNEIFGLD